jgi:von Willebrand factor type A domain
MRFLRISWVGLICMGSFAAVAGCGQHKGATVREVSEFGTGGTDGEGDGADSGSTGTGGGGISPGSGGTGVIATPMIDGGSSSDASGLDPEAACAAKVEDSKPIPGDIFIMLDQSASMNCEAANATCSDPPKHPVGPTRWTAVTDAIKGFVNDLGSSGIGVGIGFFSLESCNPADYAVPSVPIAALPGNGMAITDAIALHVPRTDTKTVPALQGAIQYATTYTMNTPGRTASVVFVTDGLPNGCDSTIDVAAMAASTAFAATPPIKTYVVGLGATQSLDQIALAGTGNATHFFPATGNVTADLQAALKAISSTITCDYVIPTSEMQLNYGEVDVQTVIGAGGTPSFIGKVDGAAACAPKGGWFYDVSPDAGTPSKITLCPQSCEPLKASPESSVKILLGCAPIPPR